jgi:hypothetical protein
MSLRMTPEAKPKLLREAAAVIHEAEVIKVAPAVAEDERTPEDIRRGLSRHAVPGYRLARLATDLSVQGGRLGGQCLLS